MCSTSIEDASVKVKRPKLSVLRSSISRITSKLLPSSSKQSTPTLPTQGNCVIPGGKYSSRDTLDKKRSVRRTLHMSINSSPWSTSKTSTPASKKQPPPIPEKSRVSEIGRVSSKTSLSISSHQKAKTPTSVILRTSTHLVAFHTFDGGDTNIKL